MQKQPAPLMELHDVSRTYYVDSLPVHALRGINLQIPEGKLIILKGPSGSGKTTVLNVMGGLDKPSDGQVMFQGKNLATFSEKELTKWRRHQVGFVFQINALIQTLTAFENVELPLRILGAPYQERRRKALYYLDLVGLGKRETHRIFELSGGEQQRVGIARALANEPSVILADEPTGELDYHTGVHIMEIFQQLVQEKNITICLATHDPEFMRFGDHSYEIGDGRIITRSENHAVS